LFDPRLDTGSSSFDLLTKGKILVVTTDPKRPFVAYDDNSWDLKKEEGAASILKHMGFNGGQPVMLSYGDADVLHDILFRYSHKPPDSLELASRFESLRMKIETVLLLSGASTEPASVVKSEESFAAPTVEVLPQPPPLAEQLEDPAPPSPPAAPDLIESSSKETETVKASEPEARKPLPPPPSPPIEDPPPPPEITALQTPPPPETVAAAKELEQLNAEIQRLSMIKAQMERQKDQIQTMLQVERQALEEREVLVTAQAATLQSRQRETEDRRREILEKEADLERLQRRLDLTEFLAGIPGLERQDVNQIRASFPDLESIKSSSIEEVMALSRLEETKARAIYAALNPNWVEEDLLQRAQALLETGDLHGVLGCYEAMLRKNPDNEVMWFNKAEVLSMLGDREGALQAYSRVLELNENNCLAWREKADILFEISRLEEGIRALRHLMELDREQAEVVMARADELVSKKKEPDAVLLYNAILEIDPSNVKAYMGLGDCLVALGDMDMADKMYTRALGRDPQNPKALYRKGSMLNRRGRWGAGLQLFNRAIALEWNYAAPWVGKGDILLKQGKHPDALDCFNKAIGFDGNRVEAWAGKARTHFVRGESAEAEKARQNALNIDSKCDATLEMERTFERGSEEPVDTRKVLIREDSTEFVGKAVRDSKAMDEAQIARRLADMAMDREEHEDALKGYEEAIKMDPGGVDAWCGRGLALRKLGRMQEAWDAYDHAMKLDPSREDAKRGREACKREEGQK